MRVANGLDGPIPGTLRRRRADAEALADVCRALDSTLQILARELDGMPSGPSQDLTRELRRMRVLTEDVLRRLRAVTGVADAPTSTWPLLLSSLRRLGSDFARATGASVELQVQGAADHLPEEVVEVLFGVACESFRAIERHARASVVLVSLSVLDESILLDVKDDGLDLAQREAYDWCGGTKAGLVTAAELVDSVGGRLAVTSTSPRGLRLVAEVPCLPVTP